MSLDLFGFILDTIGTVMIAYTAIAVHRRFWKEHKIDEEVFRSMRWEQVIGMIGILFIIIGSVMQIPGKL